MAIRIKLVKCFGIAPYSRVAGPGSRKVARKNATRKAVGIVSLSLIVLAFEGKAARLEHIV